mmetsp:Transcript_84484/g.217579  ORF Transcript_84484/g.217579 Transcript_84484/m.217579 type:complete len:212 (-) Transcript_84484:193-828(-)
MRLCSMPWISRIKSCWGSQLSSIGSPPSYSWRGKTSSNEVTEKLEGFWSNSSTPLRARATCTRTFTSMRHASMPSSFLACGSVVFVSFHSASGGKMRAPETSMSNLSSNIGHEPVGSTNFASFSRTLQMLSTGSSKEVEQSLQVVLGIRDIGFWGVCRGGDFLCNRGGDGDGLSSSCVSVLLIRDTAARRSSLRSASTGWRHAMPSSGSAR